MTDAWDGRPERPERDGWHWLHHPEDLRPMVQPWNAELGGWVSGALHSPQGVVDLGFRYLGPALLPTEVAAREAAAAEAMREACAQYCNGRERIYAARACASPDVPDQVVASGMAACFESAEDAIRALPLPAADALARALDQARAEEREACAQELDCGCAVRADVLARLATDGEKRASYLCVHGDACCALQAAAIRARGKEPQHDR